ncbi:ATP-dependent RNA helicase [Dirofilaria immitis]
MSRNRHKQNAYNGNQCSAAKKKFRRTELPVDGVYLQLVEVIRENSISVIVGETGSGKSTQIPQICYNEGLIGSGLLAVTQPRRVAAITLARRVALEMNSNLGEVVAYKVRFENTTSSETKIVYGTDGIFLRETFYNSLLTDYSIIIVDEAHERSVHTDVLLYLLKLCYKQRLDTSNPLKSLSFYIVEGRTYPVEIFYANSLDKKDDDYVFNVLATVLQIHRTEPLNFDVLVFLTGQEEIEIACKKMQEASRLLTGGLIVLPLYAGLPPSAQMRVFEPASIPYARKIIFATNIAETSITIPGVRIIVDSGKIKVKTFLPDRHIDILRVENISQCSATQRAGRAGREAPGKCYRLYSEKHFHSLSKATAPEILRSNLAVVLLELLRIGLRRTKSLALISNPRKESLEAAEKHLRLLDAVKRPDKKGRLRLTELGTRLSSFPVDPAFARALIAASQNECLEEVLTIVAFMSTDSIFVSSAVGHEQTNLSKCKFEAPEGDHCTLLNVYRGYRLARKEKKLEEWCEANHVHQRILNTVFKIRRQLRDICSKNSLIFRSCGTDTDKLRKTLCQGLFMNACVYERSQDRYNLLISPGTSLKIHPSSCLSRSRPTAFIFTDLVRTNELYARDITVIDLEWAKELLDSKKTVLKMFLDEKLHSLIHKKSRYIDDKTTRKMNKCWDDEAQKLFKNVGEQFSQIFVNDERTQFDAEIFLSLFEQYLSEPNTVDWNRMKPLSLKFQQNYESLPKCSEKEERDEILKRVSVVKLNGGLGTTMGCNGPKSLIELRSGLTFLDFAIGHVRHFNEQNNSSVPLVLMNSFNTDKAVYEYLADRKINVKTFLQSKCPRIFVKNSMPVPLKDGGENIEGWYPPGHGNIFKSMHFTGVLDELLAQGRDICFISNIDNTGATIDLRIAKLMVENNLEYVMECIEKTEVDKKGGTLVEINGYIMHLEMPQVPRDHISDFCSAKIFKIFNTNNIWVNLRAVKKKLAQMKMDIIVNKKVLSNGEFVNQLETSLGGAIRNFDKVLSIKVPRSRFLPVKNTQELLAIMSDLYEVTENFSLQFVRKDKAPIIELSEHFSKISEFRERFCEIPRLRELKRLKVEGNIYFEHDVILKDNVEIIADQGQKLKVAKGECLENIKLVQTAHSKEKRNK